MGIAGLKSLFRSHSRIALDTSIFIYQLQAHPKYAALTNEVFAWLELPKSLGVTSTITITELLVGPYREGNQRKADEILALLSTYPNLEWLAPSLEVADLAAQIRARHGLRTPDAIQAATAIVGRATALVTNDRQQRKIAGTKVILLDDLA